MPYALKIDLSESEQAVILNALNYFANGCSASECSTLLGMEQNDVQALFQKVLAYFKPSSEPSTKDT